MHPVFHTNDNAHISQVYDPGSFFTKMWKQSFFVMAYKSTIVFPPTENYARLQWSLWHTDRDHAFHTCFVYTYDTRRLNHGPGNWRKIITDKKLRLMHYIKAHWYSNTTFKGKEPCHRNTKKKKTLLWILGQQRSRHSQKLSWKNDGKRSVTLSTIPRHSRNVFSLNLKGTIRAMTAKVWTFILAASLIYYLIPKWASFQKHYTISTQMC